MNTQKPLFLLALALAATLGGRVEAGDVEERLSERLKPYIPEVAPADISKTPVENLYEVLYGTQVIYVTADGNFLMQGKLIDIQNQRDLTEARLGGARLKALEALGEAKMVVYAPKEVKHTITVFTDLDCPYCRKLHGEIDSYLKEGIKVRYLLFPRAGVGSPTYEKSVSVWCADDRQAALTAAKAGKEVAKRECDNPIADHLKLGEELEVSGTPTIITDTGRILPGYVPADRLAQMLDKLAAHP